MQNVFSHKGRAYRSLIFLDLDGVLNSMRSLVAIGQFSRNAHLLDAVAVQLLAAICAQANAAVVISASLRGKVQDPAAYEAMFAKFEPHRLGLVESGSSHEVQPSEPYIPVVGCTPLRSDRHRGEEIRQWLTESGFTGPYAILDDTYCDIYDDQPLVKVCRTDGLSLANAVDALRCLQASPEVIEDWSQALAA